MKQAALSIILAFILSMGIASCSHRSRVPFLDRLGVNTDSVLFDSLPEPCYLNTSGNMLTNEQCDSLNIFYCSTKIVSIKQIGDNYLVSFIAGREGMFSLLYDKEGNVLDKCHQLYLLYGSKEQKEHSEKGVRLGTVVRSTPPPGTVDESSFNWERHFVDNDKFEVTGRIQNTDSIIKYLYEVSNNKITQIKKTVINGMNTALIDIQSLPTSQAYKACDLMNKHPKRDIYSNYDGCITASGYFYKKELRPFIYYNAPAVLKWVSDHRGENPVLRSLEQLHDNINDINVECPHFPKDYLEKQIMKMKDKDARDYILKAFADYDAEWEAELKKYQ